MADGTEQLQDLPVLGAALKVAHLDRHSNWLISGARDVEIQDFYDYRVLDGDWPARVDQARRWLDGYPGRIAMHGPFWDLPLAAGDPLIRGAVQRRMSQAMDIAEAMGATQMVVHSPFTTWDAFNLPWFGDRDRIEANVRANLGEAVSRAEAIGLTLVIENIEDRDPMDRVLLARSFNSPNVKVSLDTGHAIFATVSTGGPPVDYHVLAAGTALDHIHLQDADGHADRHWPPGQGSVNWPALFAALKRTGATPRLHLELKDHARIPDAFAHLQGLGLVR